MQTTARPKGLGPIRALRPTPRSALLGRVGCRAGQGHADPEWTGTELGQGTHCMSHGNGCARARRPRRPCLLSPPPPLPPSLSLSVCRSRSLSPSLSLSLPLSPSLSLSLPRRSVCARATAAPPVPSAPSSQYPVCPRQSLSGWAPLLLGEVTSEPIEEPDVLIPSADVETTTAVADAPALEVCLLLKALTWTRDAKALPQAPDPRVDAGALPPSPTLSPTSLSR